ncbi:MULTISPECIES: fimbrial protein [Providencia]|uniref:Fimbrial protein n=1 Tax=Providencia rustigianii DSM 4541 TaxID=500637 RepID=D1P0S6_9GAMM|nr:MULTISPECIES: fimbrial protein [Providencia]EFB72945.1 fimbrial protein [Providencia rustigianii DSM 4541]MTC56395.1 fimbrial protein [Providencia rustigianii]SUC25340.1 Type-1A pilin [Providencia rustigianii]
MNPFFIKLTSIFIFIYSESAISACIQNPRLNNLIVNVPSRTYTIQYDDASTKELGRLVVKFANGNINTYSGTNGQCGRARLYASYVNGWVPNGNKVSATNIPGISVEIVATAIGSINVYSRYPIQGRLPWTIVAPQWTMIIRKTGAVTQSGSLKAGHVAKLIQDNPNHINWNLSSLNIPANAIRINVAKCTVKSSSYTVNLGTWYDTQFKGIGSVSSNVSIPVTLNCAAGTNIKTTVTSSAGYVDTATGKIKLAGTGSATGIAIQLLDRNNSPIRLNTKNTLQNGVASGDYNFNWKARYIKTAEKVTPGTANATATVNIRYE